jgi:hypothetical protein
MGKAEQFYRDGVDTAQTVYGVHDHRSLVVMYKLAALYTTAVVHSKATKLYKFILQVLEEPESLEAVNCLGLLAGSLESEAESQDYKQSMQSSQVISQVDKGPERDSLTPLLDPLKEARQYFERAHSISMRKYSSDEPSVYILATTNLADFYRRNSFEPFLTEQLYSSAVEASYNSFGDEHIETLASMSHLAFFYYERGNYDSAEMLYLDCLVRTRRLMGDHHVDTLAAISDLAGFYYSREGYIFGI